MKLARLMSQLETPTSGSSDKVQTTTVARDGQQTELGGLTRPLTSRPVLQAPILKNKGKVDNNCVNGAKFDRDDTEFSDTGIIDLLV